MGLGALAKAAGGAASGLPAGLLGLTKARLDVYKPIVPRKGGKESAVHPAPGKPEKSYEFDYNPKEIVFGSQAVVKTVTTGSGTKDPQQQVVGSKGGTLTFELFFSIFEVGGLLDPKPKIHDLVKLKDELLALTSPHKDTIGPEFTPTPPLVAFSWGDLITDPALVTKVDVVYTHMLPNGVPVRMKATVNSTGIMKEKKGTNPTSGGRTNRKTHTLLAGETLAGVAFTEFNDAGLWRAIAEENEIDDPMRLTAGSVLLLPSMET